MSSEIKNIWAIGRNYKDHAAELKNEVPSSPMIFLKATSSVVLPNDVVTIINLPTWATDIHHEIEIALQLDANLQFAKIGLALDLTERTIQSELKKKSHPWTLAKCFKNSCPLSPMILLTPPMRESLKNKLEDFRFYFKINNIKKQFGNADEMIFPPNEMKSFLEKHFNLNAQDLLLTGTPAGVGPVRHDDLGQAQLFYKEEVIIDWKVHFLFS